MLIRSPFFWRSLCPNPSLILTVTPASASLSRLQSATEVFAVFEPVPYVLDPEANLATPFLLRTFLDFHVPPTDKKPFRIVVVLPPDILHPQRLASQVIAVLLQLKMPPYVVTTARPSTLSPSKLPCLFWNQAVGKPLPWKMTFVSLLFLAVASVCYWYQPSQPEIFQPEAPMKTQKPAAKKASVPEAAYQPILAALKAHRPTCQLVALAATPAQSTATFIAAQPKALDAACRMLTLATQKQWEKSCPRYRQGHPPLYVSKMTYAIRG